MITSISWVPRGASKNRPARFEVGPEEYSRIKILAKQETESAVEGCDTEGDDASRSFAGSHDTSMDVELKEESSIADLPAELRMEEYDDEDNNIALGEDIEIDDANELFEVMDHGESALAVDADSEDEDAADDEIRPGDTLLVVASTEDDCSHLEVHLYAEDGNLYTHHDITLREFPLCTAWLDCPPFQTPDGGQHGVGSYIAVGTFEPAIELWNLDVLDPLEPSATLGGEDHSQQGRKKGKKSKKHLHPDSHTAAVMSLSWNNQFRHALCSGSADSTVKVWDVTTQMCQLTLTHHTDKVQCVQWHPQEQWVVASASFDRTVRLQDCRVPSGSSPASALSADPESLRWDPLLPFHLYCAQEDGCVLAIDVRKLNTPLFNFQAHAGCVSALSFSPTVPGMLVTASVDKTVRVWDVRVTPPTPHLVMYKSMNVGKIFALDFYRNSVVSSVETTAATAATTPPVTEEGYLLACGGDGGLVAIWEADESEVIRRYFVEGQGRATAGLESTGSAGEGEAVATVAGHVGMDETGTGKDVEQKKKKKKKKKIVVVATTDTT